jgi:hypothetical protein
VVDEEFESNEVELVRLGEGEGLAYKAGEALAQGIIPTLDMCGQPRLFTDRLVVAPEAAEDLVIGGPEVAEGCAVPISGRNPLPPSPATGRAAIADEVGYDLSRASTQRDPDPSDVFFEPTKDHSSSSSSSSEAVGGTSGGLSGRAAASSRNQRARVGRLTQKVR